MDLEFATPVMQDIELNNNDSDVDQRLVTQVIERDEGPVAKVDDLPTDPNTSDLSMDDTADKLLQPVDEDEEDLFCNIEDLA